MALDVSALTDYVDENRDGLIGKLVTEAKSATIADVQTGFKFKGAINLFDTDVVLQDDSSCGWNADGTTTLDQRILTVGAIKIQEALCVKTLNKKYTQHMVKAGSADDVVPFEQQYTELKTAKIAYANEVALWQGDTASGTANLARFDGWLKIIDAEAGVIAGNASSATSITKANVMGIVDDIFELIPSKLLTKGDVSIICGSDVFRLYVLALRAADLYHYDAENSNMELTIPGTSVKLMAVEGLTGTDRIIAGRIGTEGNFVVGVDLENEEEKYEMWYSKDNDEVRFSVAYKMGTQIKYPDEIVEFTLSA